MVKKKFGEDEKSLSTHYFRPQQELKLPPEWFHVEILTRISKLSAIAREIEHFQGIGEISAMQIKHYAWEIADIAQELRVLFNAKN